ncbi:peptide chain release factor N(5)-glutamine methyltransferase [Desulforhopalus vacuolatus]|uniref:peptide chain release factor N(5)-glutamine methyltransferase n=1 Tax=Desulforhopalus vacuolatus TaxID=40414 RepID=UPI001963FB98|nr:peptide chain release factor N(5)-glutamine methyltransferase [Desulforhopalus vacuolatus]MBM9520692.1 peptide chain release factor N(5)-glutamine methyltransferase [Desulforhopalus vacuolatus]
MRYSELWARGSERLAADGIVEAEFDARLLLEAASGMNYTALLLAANTEADPTAAGSYQKMLARRLLREPVAYIVGEQEFWSHPFHVTPSVLIPRPETEFLIEQVLQLASPVNLAGNVLDLCTGSGAIAVVLGLELPQTATLFASDISAAALAVAVENSSRHLPVNRVSFLRGNLLEPIAGNSLSLVISNPPYVLRHEVECEIEPDVRDYEPHLALDGGEDGLDLIRQILLHLRRVLKADGEFFMEFGSGQGNAVRELFATDFDHVQIYQDYAGHDRVLHARLAPQPP